MSTDAQAIARPPVISALGVICAAQFVLQLDLSIVNVALPTIQRELGYALTFGSLLLLGGRLGDLLGRRRLLVLGLVLFGLAGLSCPAASIGATTGVDRGEQGLAGGLLTTGQQVGVAVGLALLATLAATHTAQTGSLAAGYGFSYLVATGIVLLAIVLVATQLNHQAYQAELARRRLQAVQIRVDAPPPQELKKQ